MQFYRLERQQQLPISRQGVWNFFSPFPTCLISCKHSPALGIKLPVHALPLFGNFYRELEKIFAHHRWA